MSNRNLARIPAATSAEVCQHFRLGREATALQRDDLTPGQFLDLLTARGLFKDATRFLAHALPKREAVWWAVLCVWEVVGPSPPEPIEAGLRAAEAWVKDASETNRRAARAAAKVAGLSSPAGLTASAAFQSGGSLGPPDGPVILPSENATARRRQRHHARRIAGPSREGVGTAPELPRTGRRGGHRGEPMDGAGGDQSAA